MNRLHEPSAEAARLEDRIHDPAGVINDPELAADARMRSELAALPQPRLPDPVRNRVLAMARMRRRRPWLMAMAAVLGLALVVPVIFISGSDHQAPGAAEAHELQVALTTIAESGQQALALAGTQFGRHLAPADLGLDRLPLKLFPTPPNAHRNDDHDNS